jgi:hypothetical protein
MSVYSADEVIGKNLFAKKTVNIKKLPDSSSETLYVAKRGDNVGQVYSFVERGAKVWWQLLPKGSNLSAYQGGYAMHESDAFDLEKLKSQGLLTDQQMQENKDKENETLWDKFSTSFMNIGDAVKGTTSFLKYFLPVVIVLVALILLFMLYKNLNTLSGGVKNAVA